MKEHDIVVLKKDFKGLKKGLMGAIVYIYGEDEVEVEFTNPEDELKTIVKRVPTAKLDKLDTKI